MNECRACGFPVLVHLKAHADWCEDIRALNSLGNVPKTHCNRGHERTPENTYVYPGWPLRTRCRLCRRIKRRSA